MWPVSDEEIRNLGESRALVASISPSGGTWKLNSKSRCSKSYIELKKNTLRDQCHQTIISSQSCFAVVTAQSFERLPSSFGAAEGRRYLVGAEHFEKKWALSRGLIFWRPSILMFPGIFSTCLTRTFLTRPRALMITRTISVLRPHIFEISLYFNSFSTILTGYLFSGYSHINQEAFLQLLVLYNDVRHIEFDFCFQCEPAYPRG